MGTKETLRRRFQFVASQPSCWLIVIAVSVLVLPLGCYRYWIEYHQEPLVAPAVGGQFQFWVWQSKNPNPKYFDSKQPPKGDTSFQSLILMVGFDPPKKDTTILVKLDSISCVPPGLLNLATLDSSLLDTTRTYAWMRLASIQPILIPLYHSEMFTISFRATVVSELHPEISREYMFSVVIQPIKKKRLRIVDVLEL
jgi:hypothetical protein